MNRHNTFLADKTDAAVSAMPEDRDAFVFVVHRRDEYNGARGRNKNKLSNFAPLKTDIEILSFMYNHHNYV